MFWTLNRSLCAFSLFALTVASTSASASAPDEPEDAERTEPIAEAGQEMPDTSALEAPAESVDDRAQRLFREGEEAYWLGDFDLAIERFEEAYRLSKVVGMLYNVGLAYQRRHEMSRQAADLQRARAVFRNYLEADNAGLIDPRHVEAAIAEIDAKLAVVSSSPEDPATVEEGEISAPAEAPESCMDLAPSPTAQVDSGRRSRVLGGAVMGAGGLLIGGGIVSLTVLSLKGREFEAVLAGVQADQQVAGCGSVTSKLCDDLQASADITVSNGYRANVLAGAVGGSLLAVGLGGLITGAILHRRGSADRSRRSEVVVTPTLGGAAILGRF